ncbi:MAG: FtsX-like permease family protein [Spiroplasma sp.]
MRILAVNILRGVKKRLFQYIGIVLLIIIIVATMTGLYGSSDRGQAGFFKVEQNSGVYDYRIKIESLNDYKDSDAALAKIKESIKGQFPKTLPDYNEIVNQIDGIKIIDIQNGVLPSDVSGLNKKLKIYLLNWGINYKAILLNDILKTTVKKDSSTSNYQITNSFLKSFTYHNKKTKLFFVFEDAFYLDDMTFPLIESNTSFDFSPTRNGFNEVYMVRGKKPAKKDEVVINPIFAKANNITLGSKFEFLPNIWLRVVGFGYTYWGIVPPLTVANIDAGPKNTTPVFSTREWINEYLYNNSSNALFFLKVTNKDVFFQDKLESILNQIFNFNYGSLIVADSEDIRSGSIKETFDMQNIVYSSISFIVLLAAVFIVLSYVKKELELQKKQVGVLKALGYNNNEISFGFTILFFLLSIISTSLGFLLGLLLQMRFNGLGDVGFFLPLPTVYFSLISFIIGVFVTTIIFTLASYLQAYKNVTKNPLFLIYDYSSSTSAKWLAILKKPFNYWKFKPRLAASFALKSVGKLTLIFFIFIFATFLLMFENVAIDIFDAKINNFYSYVNKDVYYYNQSISMYKFDDSAKIKAQVYDWTIEKKIDSNKEIKADDFHINSEKKYKNLEDLKDKKDYKGYYIKSAELTLLYKNTQESNNCLDYIRPPGTNFISEFWAKLLCKKLTIFFELIINYSGINPKVQALPGFSLGQNILNNYYYPNLEFKANYPITWKGHNQGPLISKQLSIITLYNNSDSDNPLTWKKWFNLKEEKDYDIDSIFNSSHNLRQQEVTYVDGFGKKNTKKVYIVPVVIAKTVATLNKYKVGNEVLAIINDNSRFIPIIFNIKGITTTNLDSPAYYANIDDLRKVVGYVDDSGQPLTNSFNNFYSKDSDLVLPLNSINIAQPDNNYSLDGLKNNWTLINKLPIIMPLIKDRLGQIFSSIKTIIEISKKLTVLSLAFVLIIIVNMILDNNLLIIAMMKSLGYRINEINLLIIGSYIFTLFLAFIFGTVLSYVTWLIILWIVANLSSTIFLLPISTLTIFISFLWIFAVIIIGYIVGLYFIKFKPISKLLQSD